MARKNVVASFSCSSLLRGLKCGDMEAKRKMTTSLSSSSRISKCGEIESNRIHKGARNLFTSLRSVRRGNLTKMRMKVQNSRTIYTSAHSEMRASLSRLIEREIAPHVDDWEKEGIWPAKSVLKKLGEAGFLGLTKPTEYGGSGLDYTYSVAMAEEMGNIRCGGVPMAVGVVTDMATPALAKYGSSNLLENYLKPTIQGDLVPCLGVSESSGGSDVAAIRTKATPDGDEDLLISGEKMWITNGAQADWCCACVVTETEIKDPHRNKSLVVIPMDSPGVTVARTLDKLGMRSSDTAQIFFDEVRVPQANIIGERGMGFTYQMEQFQEERIFCAANVLKPLDNAVCSTAEYASSRKIFGRALLQNQSVQFRLSELQTEIEALRALVYRATDLYVQGENVTLLASMCKLKAGRLAREVTDSCLQYYGGMGFMNETDISRMYRDLRLVSIGGGADEVMLGIISKLMLAGNNTK